MGYMVFLIKRIYRNDIDDGIHKSGIAEKLKSGELKTSSLDAATGKIFDKCAWKPSFLDKAKREAIKSTLRDRIHAQKAARLPDLVRQLKENETQAIKDILNTEFQANNPDLLQELARNSAQDIKTSAIDAKNRVLRQALNNQMPDLVKKFKERRQLPTEKIKKIVDEMQEKFKQYDEYEIRHLFKCKWIFEKQHSNKTKLNGLGTNFEQIYDPKKTSKKERISIFESFHNSAKKELYDSKTYFDRLTTGFANKLNVKEHKVDKLIYYYCN